MRPIMHVENQKELIENLFKENKFTLIILDACRADYFERFNRIEGKYKRVLSSGKYTNEWLKNTFDKFHEVTYVSATPFVNSKRSIQGFNAKYHFKEVIDVWDFGWDEKLGTVPPQAVNNAVPIRNRFIIHYEQPHFPFIGQPKLVSSHKNVHPLRGFPVSVDIQKYPREFVRKAYEGNLNLVLKYVKLLLPRLPGKIVVTSDHGEMLGEKGHWLHHDKGDKKLLPILCEVPWLEIKRVV